MNTVHGCIDGFSQKLIWLVVSTSNNDPVVIANRFLCIQKHHNDDFNDDFSDLKKVSFF